MYAEETRDSDIFVPHKSEFLTMTDTTHIGVGIDTGRFGHHVTFLDANKRSATNPYHFTADARGHQKLDASMQKLANKHDHVHFHVRVDAAGQYANNLLEHLRESPFELTLTVGQPQANRAYRESIGLKQKSDPNESLACARFAVVERPEASHLSPVEFRQLRDLVSGLTASSKQETRLVNQLHGILSQVFPELATYVKKLSTNKALTLLEKYPTPEKLARARVATLRKIPHLTEKAAERIKKAAGETVGASRGELAETLVLEKVKAIREEQRRLATLTSLARKVLDALPDGPHRRIETIPGIGTQTAAALIATIGSIDRFETAKDLVGYFGVYPELDKSGTDKDGKPREPSTGPMSKKGNDLVRRLLFTAAQSAIVHNPPVRALFARQIGAGKDYHTAIGHCMAKLLRQAFHLWTTDRDFDPDCQKKDQQETDREVALAEKMLDKNGVELETTSCEDVSEENENPADVISTEDRRIENDAEADLIGVETRDPEKSQPTAGSQNSNIKTKKKASPPTSVVLVLVGLLASLWCSSEAGEVVGHKTAMELSREVVTTTGDDDTVPPDIEQWFATGMSHRIPLAERTSRERIGPSRLLCSSTERCCVVLENGPSLISSGRLWNLLVRSDSIPHPIQSPCTVVDPPHNSFSRTSKNLGNQGRHHAQRT